MSETPEEDPQGSPNKTPAETYRAAAALHAAAIDLSHCRTRFTQPSDSHATLGELIDVQQHLMNVLHELCQWHQQVRAGTDCADQKQSVDGVLEVAFEIQAALHHAEALHQSLIRAHHAGTQVRWYNPDPTRKSENPDRPNMLRDNNAEPAEAFPSVSGLAHLHDTAALVPRRLGCSLQPHQPAVRLSPWRFPLTRSCVKNGHRQGNRAATDVENHT